MNEDNKIWSSLIAEKFSINNDIDNITIEWSIVDDNATFYKNKNILIEMIDSKLSVIC